MAVKFKDIDLDSDLAPIVPHVEAANAYGAALQNLQSVWDSLTLLGQLSGGGTDMSARGAPSGSSRSAWSISWDARP